MSAVEPDVSVMHRLGRTGRVVVPLALGAVVVAFGVPLVAGVDWRAVARLMDRVSPMELAALTVIWLAGLWLQTIAIAGAMPGLSHRRAFFLNLTGSSVSNLVPLGGTAGTALNYWTCRRWGLSTGDFVRWALVTNFWDTGVKVLLPGVAVAWLALAGIDPGRHLLEAASGGLVLLIAYVAGGWLLLHRDWGSRAIARAADRIRRQLDGSASRSDRYAAVSAAFSADTRRLVRAAYGRLTVGKLAYAVLQAVLLWGCLASVGWWTSPVVAFAAFAVERLLSVAVLTPGASGLAEMGTVGVLVSLGVDPASAVAGVLLYRGFVFWLEIPTGGALLGLEVLGRRRRRKLPTAESVGDTEGAAVPGPTGATRQPRMVRLR